MNRRVIVSLLIILMSLTAIGGSTLAWFTATTDPIENVFTAGTVAIEANEEVITDEVNIENWNPGDCVETFAITTPGRKLSFAASSHMHGIKRIAAEVGAIGTHRNRLP